MFESEERTAVIGPQATAVVWDRFCERDGTNSLMCQHDCQLTAKLYCVISAQSLGNGVVSYAGISKKSLSLFRRKLVPE